MKIVVFFNALSYTNTINIQLEKPKKLKIGGLCVTEKRIEQIWALFKESPGILRSSAMRKLGICSKDLKELENEGLITRLKDGYYAWSSMLDDLSDFYIATATIPDATIYGISAAAQYNLTTVIPDAVHIKVPNKGKIPQAPLYPPIQIIREKMPAFSLGRICGNSEPPIYDRERTVCDCIKHKSEIGVDIALEILKNYMNGPRDLQKLYSYADTMRIRTAIHPYVEALI